MTPTLQLGAEALGTALGFVVGSLVGAVATVAGSYAVHRARTRERTDRLRQAFRSELEALSYVDEFAERGDYEGLTEAVEPPVVYESNADSLGHLTGEEIEAVVAFYSDLYWLRGQEDIEDKKERVHEVVEKRERALRAITGASEE